MTIRLKRLFVGVLAIAALILGTPAFATAAATPIPPGIPAPRATATPTHTPTNTPTNTPVPPTATPVPPTDTPVPPTDTPVPPTATEVTATATMPVPTTVTPTEAATETSTAAATEPATVTPTLTPTASVVRTNDLILNYQSGASEDQIAALVKAVNGVEVKRIPEIHVILVRVPDNMAQPAVAQRALTGGQMSAQASGGIVEKNLTFHAAAPYVPNDPRFSMAFPNGQTQLQDVAPDGVVNAGIYAPLAWGIATTRGSGVTVAVLDTGVNGVGTAGANPDLTPNVLTTGYDFVDDDTSAAEVLGGNYSGHGTHVAGIIAAAANNGKGIAGIAFMAKILPVRVLNPSGNGDTMDVAQGIIYATDHGAKVINMSFVGNSTTYSYTLEAAINYALSKGVVPIAAAGNESKNINTNPVYPASLSTVISVGATDHTLAARWDPTPGAVGSNYGKVDVYAPGESIWSTCLPQASSGLFACNPNDPYVTATGTSMATAEVSGAAALIIGAKVATTPATVREALTCGTLTFPGHPNDPVGVGEIQLDFALNWHQNSNNCKITLPNDDVRTPTNILSVPFSTVVGVDGRNATHATDDPDLMGQSLRAITRLSVSGKANLGH